MIHGMAICAGGGGLELALRLALGDSYRCVLYIEREIFAAATLVSAMEAGRLDKAPLWDDLKTFTGDVASPFVGNIDILSGGIPCQPHSVAGRQRGEDDPRDLWPDTARIISQVRPDVVFLENVPGIMGYYHERIGGDLVRMGYATEEGLFSAAEVGASHIRQRLFILAYSRRFDRNGRMEFRNSNAENGGTRQSIGREDRNLTKMGASVHCGIRSLWWQHEPHVDRMAHGVADRVDKYELLGNGVVPVVAAHAFNTLGRRVGL